MSQSACASVCMYDIANDIWGHTGVWGPWPIRVVFVLDGSSREEQGAMGDVMPEERRPRQIAVMN